MSEKQKNYRVSAEIILILDGKALITKRAPHCKTGPGAWHVPAGKIKYKETPKQGAIRECFEEAGIKVEIEKELDCRAVTIMHGDEKHYRLVFTYLAKPAEPITSDSVILNDEHTEYKWITRRDLETQEFPGMSEHLRNTLIEKVFV